MTRSEARQYREKIEAAATLQQDAQAMDSAWMYPGWEESASYAVGARVRYDNRLFKCLQAHSAQAAWTPVAASSLWTELLPGQDGTAVGQWVQPDSTNPYQTGDRVSYNGETWVSTCDNNVWAPGVYGWDRQA